METFFNPKIEESIKELAFQLFKEEILHKHKYEIETIFDKIKTQGNYQIDIGEPVIQLESMCGFEPKGLLGAGEFYIEYWRQKGINKVGGFRSPMSCKENARVMKVCNKEEVDLN